jgi:hypothetical protein
MNRHDRRAAKSKRNAIKISPRQAERLVDNLRLLLTFIDANIPPEVTEPNRERRMALGRKVLHEKRSDDYGEVAFALHLLADFVMANYTGQAAVVVDAFDVLCELGLMERVVEDIKPGHPMYGKQVQEGFMMPDTTINRRAEIEHILTSALKLVGYLDHPVLAVHIEGDYAYVIVAKATAKHPTRAIRCLLSDKIRRMLSGQDPITVEDGETWTLLAPMPDGTAVH